MRYKNKKNILVVVCALCCTGFGIQNASVTAASLSSIHIQDEVPTESQSISVIVTEAVSQNTVVPSVTPRCNTVLQMEVNELQGVASVNLNQPGSCFSLGIGEVLVQQSLSVHPVISSHDSVVVAPSPIEPYAVSSANISPGFASIPSATIPLLLYISTIVVVRFTRWGIHKENFGSQNKYVYSLAQLHVYQC